MDTVDLDALRRQPPPSPALVRALADLMQRGDADDVARYVEGLLRRPTSYTGPPGRIVTPRGLVPERETVREIACPTCMAAPGAPCRGKRGPRTANHASRVALRARRGV